MIDMDVRLSEVEALKTSLLGLCERLDPESVPLYEAPEMWTSFATMEKLVAGAKLRMARRAEEAGKWRERGHRSAADWMGRASGTSTGSAKAALETSKRVKDQPHTDRALKHGELSEGQANSISDAAEANPDAEKSLLRKAKTRSAKDLKEACGKAKAAADKDPEGTRRRQHANRSARQFRDAEGMWNLHLRNTPEIGAEFKALVQPWLDGIFERARRLGQHEALDAYLADAIAEMFRAAGRTSGGASGQPRPHGPAGGHGGPSEAGASEPEPGHPVAPKRGSKRPDHKILAFIDWDLLRHSDTGGGKRCEIAGIGSVPESTVRELFGDAYLWLIITKGQEVATTVNLGRPVTAAQRTALEARGYVCAVPGCGATHHLDIDHVTGWSVTHTTELTDLDWLCRFHHDLKSYRGYRLDGPPGRRRWIHPDGTADQPDHPAMTRRGRPPPTGPPSETGRLFSDPPAA